MADRICLRCDKSIKQGREKEIELNAETLEVCDPGTAPWSNTEESQGVWEVGQDCYRILMKSGKLDMCQGRRI